MTEPTEPAAGTLSFGPFTLTPHERLLTRDGVALPLGARTFDALVALVSRPREVVSKWDLMARVWPGINVEEVNLRFHIAASKGIELRSIFIFRAVRHSSQKKQSIITLRVELLYCGISRRIRRVMP